MAITPKLSPKCDVCEVKAPFTGDTMVHGGDRGGSGVRAETKTLAGVEPASGVTLYSTEQTIHMYMRSKNVHDKSRMPKGGQGERREEAGKNPRVTEARSVASRSGLLILAVRIHLCHNNALVSLVVKLCPCFRGAYSGLGGIL